MKRKTLLFGFVILLLILIIILLSGNFRGKIFPGQTSISITDTTLVNRIIIVSEGDSLILEKDDTLWMVNNTYPAEPVAISNFLFAFSRIGIKGKTLNIGDPDKVRNIVIRSGKRDNSYHLLPDSVNPVLFRNGSTDYFFVEVDGFPDADLDRITSTDKVYWRNKQLFSLQPDEIKNIKVHAREDWGEGFILERANGEFKLKTLSENAVPDSLVIEERVLMYISYFSDIFYDSELKDPETTGRILNSEPEYLIEVLDKSDNKYKLAIYPLYNNNERDIYRALIRYNDEDEILITRYIILDLLMQTLDHFRK